MLTTLNTSVQDDVLVVSLDGSLSWQGIVRTGETSETAPIVFRRFFEEQIAKGIKNFVLDLRACTGFDSAGIGTLTLTYTKIANMGGHIPLVVKPKGKIFDTLEITKLIKVFTVYDSIEAAVKYVREASVA